ncbi:acetyl-CoA synthetase-like protein [Artomyces pyxidatus]|uniref:Acetyl-CoA synthetase-like protein n=1 Tax=Artomyces pyxidatus TaxID=48021 RepID=A0ACB8T169_9AGAM|nr:acetyl-CoA synthetase-like protein [Artomyces pyxidatus]
MSVLPQTQVLSSQTFRAPPLEDRTLTLPDLYDWQYEHSPDHPLFLYDDVPGKVRTIAWSEAVRAIHNAAHVVASRLPAEIVANAIGGRPIVVACLCATDTVSYVTVEVGIMRAGFSVFPISPRNSPEAVAHLLRETGTRHLLVSGEPMMQGLASAALKILHKELGSELELTTAAMPQFEEIYTEAVVRGEFQRYPTVSYDFNAAFLIMHSSGSTSFPKPIRWSHRNGLVLCGIPWWGDMDLCGLVMSCHAMPVFHGMGLLQLAIVVSTGVEMATFKPAFPATMPNPQNVLEGMMATNSMIAAGAPTFLEAWSRSTVAVAYLKKTKAVVWGGGPLSKEVGDYLISEGIEIYPQYGCTECGVLNKFMPARSLGDDWEYLMISDHCRPVFLPQGDGSFELVLVDHELHHPIVTNTKVDGRDAYATSDLLLPHPTRQGLWKIYGRKDDQIMLSTGEKTNPGPLESILAQDSHILSAVMFGRGKFQNGVIVDPRPQFVFDPKDEQALVEFRNVIWPTVERMNEFAPQHSRLFKEMILVASPSKKFEYTAKMTPRRPAILKTYNDEINALYDAVDETSQIDIPLPLDWSPPEAEKFVRQAIFLVMKRDLSSDVDLFQHGCDSLQSTYIRNSILRALRETAPDVAKRLSPSFVYERPTIAQMVAYLSAAAIDPELNQRVDLATRGKELQAIVEKYTRDFPLRPASTRSPHVSHPSPVYLITGTTGGLGSNMLAQLLSLTSVSRVYAFNRPSGSATSAERHSSAFLKRGLDANLLSSQKLVFLEGELTAPAFSLNPAMYEEILSSVTHIVHNAWRINLNLSLMSFEEGIAGVRALVDFSLKSTLPLPPRLLFVSSIGVLINFDNSGYVKEDILANPVTAVGTGYSESKWISERILDAAGEKTALKPVVVRLGQVCGDANGVWNETEWFPSVVKSALSLKCLPNLDGLVSWIPAPDAAAVMLELSDSDERTLHLVHSRPVSFTSLVEPIARDLGVPLVPYDEWLRALESSLKDKAVSEVELMQRNPALRLLDFFRTARVGRNWEPVGVARLATDKAVRASATLAKKVPSLGEDHVRRWMAAWRASGFLPPSPTATASNQQ